jgi:hypothetical protein
MMMMGRGHNKMRRAFVVHKSRCMKKRTRLRMVKITLLMLNATTRE